MVTQRTSKNWQNGGQLHACTGIYSTIQWIFWAQLISCCQTIYFDIHIQLLVTNGELLIIRAVFMSQKCTQPSGHTNVSKCLLPYSAKFSRHIIFAVFMDSSGTAKIKLLETFQLNFLGVHGIMWKQYDSYSTFAVLRGHQEQHGTLSLFQREHFQIPGGRHRKFHWH